MKVFRCDHCRHVAFFENVRCVRCLHTLAYLPDLGVVGSLDPDGEPGVWRSPLPRAAGRAYRLCRNSTAHGVCNWTVDAHGTAAFCPSCRLTHTVPDLTRRGHLAAWAKLEAAKRRLVYTLQAFGLPFDTLRFEFLADPDDPTAPRVLSGHANGLVTLNIAEADDAERERRRAELGEPYRTLLGHLRHESGHYFFDTLIAPHPERLRAFRRTFGDERADYAAALKAHYANGAPADWAVRCVSAYATAHPWEDWAETWAHYLHMVDSLDTAVAGGLTFHPDPESVALVAEPPVAATVGPLPFDTLIARWFPLTCLLNNLNRGMGLADWYPFVLSTAAVEKLRFVHDTVATVTKRG